MTPHQIIQLVGFATGAMLHFYIAWLILRRRNLIHAEKALVLLGAVLGAWFLGNMITTLYYLLGLKHVIGVFYIGDTIAFAGQGILPSALLHVHFAFWGMWDGSDKRKYYWVGIILGYIPMLTMPLAFHQLYAGSYQPPLVKLSDWIVPDATWMTLALWLSAAIDFRLSTQVTQPREQRFFQVLATALAIIGVGFVLVYIAGGRELPIAGSYLETAVMLSALFPTAICAYYIYRYGFLELIIKQSLIYGGFAAVVVVAYVYGVRRIDDFLVARYSLTPHIVESILALALVFVAQPVKSRIDHSLKQLFARELGIYRTLVQQVTRDAASLGDLESLIDFLENSVRRGLKIQSVKLMTRQQASEDKNFEPLLNYIEDGRPTVIEEPYLLDAISVNVVYPLWRDNQLVGLMLLKAPAAGLDSERRAILTVLSGQIAVTLANGQLTEEKVRLERELAQRERLALLGQMAASVAHEVKNPLSAIKSIVQVMREDDTIQNLYARDLSLIIGEIDRLNRTVTQMLTFSRPGRYSGESVPISQMIAQSAELFTFEAQTAGVIINTEIANEPVSKVFVSDGRGAALGELLNNLLLNAIQATPRGGTVSVAADVTKLNGHAEVAISVTDTGSGIAPEVRHRIFEPFFTTRQRGTGLGLAIVQRRITELGGSIEAESPAAEGRGTRFRLLLPMSASGDDDTEPLRFTI